MLNINAKTIWLGTIIELVPQDELMVLVSQFDNEASRPTIALLSSLMDTYGVEFAHPLAELALEYCESDNAEAKIEKHVRKLNKGSGSATNTSGGTAMEWFKTISDTIYNLGNEVGALTRVFNGTEDKLIDISREELKLKYESEKTTRTLIFATIGIVLTVLMFAFVYKFVKN